jgi:energy-converting hydrogenase B subunit G
MTIYDLIIRRIKSIQEKTGVEGPVTNISASSMLTAEITLISSVLVVVIMLRLVSNLLMIVAILVVLFASLLAMPLMPRLQKEQNDSLANMTFYVILALAIVIALFYWGITNV